MTTQTISTRANGAEISATTTLLELLQQSCTVIIGDHSLTGDLAYFEQGGEHQHGRIHLTSDLSLAAKRHSFQPLDAEGLANLLETIAERDAETRYAD